MCAKSKPSEGLQKDILMYIKNNRKDKNSIHKGKQLSFIKEETPKANKHMQNVYTQ